MAGRLSNEVSRVSGANGVAHSLMLSLRQRSGMGLPIGKHFVPDKYVGRGWRARVNARRENAFRVEKYLKRIGLGKEDYHFWKQIGKGLICTYTLFGLAWLWNETSPLGWWTLKPKPKEEKELAHLYERRQFPYPGDQEAMDEFIAKGGMIGTVIGPKGFVENDKDFYNFEKELQDKKFEQEALKLWLRMKNEVVSELQEKGFDVE
ncbi:uncharacterized protein LOC127240738 isoform X2 [Andrographis paniculata]|uniref:uncharacterized protein LOC127240738 isoform X2 n=1 Tax=Andrographis paniculata TaxID=175694 RepID=UPI0021E76A89|nr:uncharacterized protein LOC127240738 isoform X2 [Andrographis paniculata]